LERLQAIEDNVFDAVLTDPPYGLHFMANAWDNGPPCAEVWRELLRVCKPGALLLSFGGPRTYHRLACHIEEAGWEIRDCLMWLYGEGFPKSLNLGKAIDRKLGAQRTAIGEKPNLHRGGRASHRYGFSMDDMIPITVPATAEAQRWEGWGTALKPAWEPIMLAQKRPEKTFAANALNWGCGGLNIDACRIGTNGSTVRNHQAPYPQRADGSEDRSQGWARTSHEAVPIGKGRWPANVLLDSTAAEILDRQSGVTKSSRTKRRATKSNVGNGKTLHQFRSRLGVVEGYDDKGGASRFFFCPKAKRRKAGVDHPCLKPLELCQHLAMLVQPPEGVGVRKLIVPFAGSGTEMLAGLMVGWEHVTGIEREAKYVEIAKRRLALFSAA
jgi:site-specific DNA-methyltransferase (adenine-specific)